MDNRRRSLPAHSYRREARRLRARHGADPARLYGALRELACEHDDPLAPTSRPRMRLVVDDCDDAVPAVPERNARIEQQFVIEVRSAVQDGILRYSERQALLRRGDGLGLHRFRANLLMAMALHEVDQPTPVTARRVLSNERWMLSTPPEPARPTNHRLRLIGFVDLLMAAIFTVSLFGVRSVWPPSTWCDGVAIGSGAMVFIVCPVLFWMTPRANRLADGS